MIKTTKPRARPLTTCECWRDGRIDHDLEAMQADFAMEADDVDDEPIVDDALSVFLAMSSLRARANRAVLGSGNIT